MLNSRHGFALGYHPIHRINCETEIRNAMKAAVIPWRVFTDALNNQKPVASEKWLARWSFADGGVWAGNSMRAGRLRDLVFHEDNLEISAKKHLSPANQMVVLGCDARSFTPELKRKTAVRKQRIPAQTVDLRGGNEHRSCERCSWGEQAVYRAFTDIINMKVCTACAAEARRLGISVHRLTSQRSLARRVMAEKIQFLPNPLQGVRVIL